MTEATNAEARKQHTVDPAGKVQPGTLVDAEVDETPAPEPTRVGSRRALAYLGLCLVLACVAGRLWSILYVGGKKNEELVSTGPFSMSQNPLYFFSTVGAVGIGLLYGSLVAAAVLGVASFLIFRVTAHKEAEYLLGKFGPAYAAYIKTTPRFWPNPLLFRDDDQLQFSTRALKRTFFDGLYFLAIFPAIELIEYLRQTGLLIPAVFTLY